MEGTNQFNEFLQTIITIVVIPLLPVITTYLVSFIKQKTAELQKQINDKQLSKYLEMAENTIVTAVTAVNQIYVDKLKKTQGSLSAYEQRVAFEMARDKVLRVLGASAREAIKEIYSDFDAWLENKIEYYVNDRKSS